MERFDCTDRPQTSDPENSESEYSDVWISVGKKS